jgi:hypothetical protein
MGKIAPAVYHNPGTEILGQTLPHAERIIPIDRLLISHAFLSEIDEVMNHYDVRSRYAASMGERLAMTFDSHVYREIIMAARDTSIVLGGDDGLTITDADLASGVDATRFDAWINAIYQIAANFDNKFVFGPRYLALRPTDWYFLQRQMEITGFSLLSKDIGGAGSVAEGTLPKVAGITLVPTASLPIGNFLAEPFHAVNTTTTLGVAWTPDAVGTCKLMDISLQAEWDIRRQGTLMVARYAMGHGILRPECAVELRTAAP